MLDTLIISESISHSEAEQVIGWLCNESQYYGVKNNKERITKSIHNRMNNNNVPKLFFVRFKREIVGCVSLDYNEYPYLEKKLWLSDLYVKPQMRLNGVGKKLIDACIQFGKSINEEEIRLLTLNKGEYFKSLGWDYVRSDEFLQKQFAVYQYKI